MKDHKVKGNKRKLVEEDSEQDKEPQDADAEVQSQSRKEGWADSMAKILRTNKPKNKKSLILSKAKKDYEISKKPKNEENHKSSNVDKVQIVPAPVPISANLNEDDDEQEDSEIIFKTEESELIPTETTISSKTERKLELAHKRKLKEWENLHRSKPNVVKDRGMERELVKIATKGVTQLFNAVSMQQKTMKNKLRQVGKSEFKKDKVLSQTKEIFEDFLEEEQETF